MSNKENDQIRTQVILGILGFAGVLLGVLATIFAPIIQENIRQKNLPTQTPIIIVATPTAIPATETPVPTDTVPPGEPTSTPAPTNTPTPEPTFTPVPLEAGKDWLQNCISVVWQVYPETTTTENDGRCYTEPVANVFTTREQRFNVFYEDKVTSAQVAGMFVEVPSNSVVEINMHLEEVTMGELWVGVLGAPNFDAKGIIAAAPAGNAKNSAFSIRTMPDGKELTLTQKFKKDTGDYVFSFDVSPNTVVLTMEKYTTFNPISVTSDASDKKYLFIGYRALAPNTNHIEGNFFDLKITPRQ